ncbi:MAG: hypothetical protein IAE80_14895 [Anaerolinea sp.]|nr:hypothetical protein [Anaerolinea sp.]
MLRQYEDKLHGCRFCPMCKPAGEVSNITQLESHTTRARAMMLWRNLNGMLDWTPRAVELLYQSTLDSISEAWCISHYPVSGYVLAARAEVFAAGLAPEIIHAVVESAASVPEVSGDILLFGGEIAEWGDPALAETALGILERCGVQASALIAQSGALAYVLGAHDHARAQAHKVADAIRRSGARTVIADSPAALWALRCVYPALGVDLPEAVTLISLIEYLAAQSGALNLAPRARVKALLHDSRAAALLADALPKAEVVQPGYTGDDAALGAGTIYEALRSLVDALNIDRASSVWTRALSRSSGADDGLWQTYPALAEGLARARLTHARELGAELVIADSPLSAAYMGRFAADFGLRVVWLPALLAEVSA